MNMTTTIPLGTAKVRPAFRALLIWMLSFLAIPIAGYFGTFLVGRIDNLAAAILGGSLAGAIVGLAQTLASSRRLDKLTWTLASALGWGVGIALGTFAVGYRTSLIDLIVAGLISGAVIGLTQTLALPRHARRRWLWAPITAVLWALAWAVTTMAGINVDEQFIVFGASGASVYTALAGLTLLALGLPATARKRVIR